MLWGVVSNDIKSSIFYYKSGSFEEIVHDRNASCEDVCKELCRKWNISPLVQLLFGLRIHGKKLWLAGCRALSDGVKYEFRIRFKIPKLSDLKQLDKNAYDYFYHQVRCDVLHNAIPEIAYPKFKNDILGLCVTDMFVEMLEHNRSVDYLNDNYKKYIPKELAKHHSLFARKEIKASLKSIKNKEHDVFYVKGIYLQQIDAKAPNYLTEEYSGTTPCPKEDDLKESCSVKLQIAPFHPEQPGLRIYYAHKNSWQHVSKFADFYTIQTDEEMKDQVSLEIQNSPLGFPITMASPAEIDSFVSCISGYYRLMVKWNMDLCSQLWSPSLKFLTDRKIHGPIGGDYSYNKIEEKGSSVGSFIVRQCEKVFDRYYIDIRTKADKRETFKILYKYTEVGDQWTLFDNETDQEQDFDDLIILAKSIPVDGRYFRLPPSQHDKSPLLLLCRQLLKHAAKETGGMRNRSPVLLRAVDDLLLYKWTQRECGDGIFTRMKADYNQPTGKTIAVTLKVLKQSEVQVRLGDFVKLADLWAQLDLSEIVRMHGITLNLPTSLVLESIQEGPLDEFLRSPKHKKDIKVLDLVETAYSLAKALHFMQEKQIVHGRIRCSTLQVMYFKPNSEFVVKLGDPGLPTEFSERDVPWIAIENHDNLSACRKNLKSDIWAYATTLWEIFSRGATINVADPVQFFKRGERLPRPGECVMLPEVLGSIYGLMLQGWDEDPDKRFSSQKIFSRLLDARTKLSRNYSEPNAASNYSNSSTINITSNGTARRSKSNGNDTYNGSLLSAETEHTYIASPGTTQAYIEHCGSSIASNQSHDGGSSQVSLLNGHSSNGSQSTIAYCGGDEFEGVPTVLEFESSRLIFQGELGRGNYGRVYKGSLECGDDDMREVAIKMFHTIESTSQFKDFQREAKIMKKLEHENIVKIYGFREEPLLIIMEYINYKNCGTLQTYVSTRRSDLTVEELLGFASNIAKGMQYLEQKKIVHRDLAARNVLVANENCVKIADFGLAQVTVDGYYYHSTNSRALPIKWYAPETLSEHKFSHKSDVWSFGVTLYEMFTFGESPKLAQNEDLDAQDILILLKNGKRLERPKFCPVEVYDQLFKICWHWEHRLRPTFAEILKVIDDLSIVNGEAV